MNHSGINGTRGQVSKPMKFLETVDNFLFKMFCEKEFDQINKTVRILFLCVWEALLRVILWKQKILDDGSGVDKQFRNFFDNWPFLYHFMFIMMVSSLIIWDNNHPSHHIDVVLRVKIFDKELRNFQMESQTA